MQAAALLSVPSIHGTVEALDRVTLGHLITGWSCDRAISERNAAEQISERKGVEARVRAGGEALISMRAAIKAELKVMQGGAVKLTLKHHSTAEQLAELRAEATRALQGDDGAAVVQMSPEQIEELLNAECIRVLGERWWQGMSEEQWRLT